MNIIDEHDTRFSKIGSMVIRLKSVKLSKLSEGGCIEYIIPYELVINNVKRITGRGNIIDINDTNDSYISTYRFEKLLNESTNLSKQCYFDLVYLGINNTNDRPVCSICNKKLDFSDKLSQGYRKGSGTGLNNDEYIPYYCSASCKSTGLVTKRWTNNYEGTYESIINNGFRKTWTKSYYKMYLSAHNSITEATVRRSMFINRAVSDKCYFYIAVSDSLLKIGVSSYFPVKRISYANSILGSLNKVYVFTSDKLTIADFEYDMHLMLYDTLNAYHIQNKLNNLK
jgi:hypothetical protein